MAGRILKITLEDTHPPIWRRVIVPECITFRDLHDIIQILFGWDEDHLHNFSNYKHGLLVDCLEYSDSIYNEPEDNILVDNYLEQLPWIRYTYDFGDDWRHKIVFEKTDPSYNLRHASLLKYKGDNPMEDCGGVTPWMELTEFDPIYTCSMLESLDIPKRSVSGAVDMSEMNRGSSELAETLLKSYWTDAIEQAREMMPELKNMDNDEILDLMMKNLQSLAENGEVLPEFGASDPGLQLQMDLLNSGKTLHIVQSKTKLQKNLSELQSWTLADYLKYSRIKAEAARDSAAVFADYLMQHTDLLYDFFHRDETKALISFWNDYQSGKVVLDKRHLMAVAKCIFLGLIKLTGKRKLKLELCAEFDQVMKMIDFGKIDAIYDKIEARIHVIGSIMMAYIALSFDHFYQIYSRHEKKPMDRMVLERFIYWNGTMNQALTTFQNAETGIEYLMLPDMEPFLNRLEMDHFLNLFQIEPRQLSKAEYKKWEMGFNAAIPEWDEYLHEMAENPMITDDDMFGCYLRVASGATLTELVMAELEESELDSGYLNPDEHLALETDIWHLYAKLCTVTPIMGLNGYSREQYAQTFHVSLDHVPLFEESVLKKRITKNTPIYQFPRSIQLDMITAMRKGKDAYVRTLTRLSKEYKSNQALLMAQATLACDDMIEKHPELIDLMEKQFPFDSQNMDEFDYPKPKPFVREQKKIGRNDPCPCGSGRKYKHCCGK